MSEQEKKRLETFITRLREHGYTFTHVHDRLENALYVDIGLPYYAAISLQSACQCDPDELLQWVAEKQAGK